MEVVEQQLRESAYGGLKARDARLKERHDAHVQGKEADELLRLAQIKLAEKDALELAAREPQASSAQVDTPDEIRKELNEVAKTLTDTVILSVVANMAQVTIEETPFRKLTAKLQFPDDYPKGAVTVHVQSATLAEGLLERLAASAGAAAATNRGQSQAGLVIQLLVKFVKGNCLATAYDDLARLKQFFTDHNSRKGDESKSEAENLRKAAGANEGVHESSDSHSSKKATGSNRSCSDANRKIDCSIEHAKQSTGEVNMMLKAGDYYLHVHTAVPRGYPAQPLKIEITDSNLPDALVRLEAAKLADMAEKMAEYKMPQSDVGAAQARAGAGEAATSKTEALASKGKQTVLSFNKGQHLAAAAKERHEATQKRRKAEAQAFVAQPSLFTCVEHLCMQFLFPLATGHCAVCTKRLLPADSRKLGKVPADMQVLKVYCGHHYHYACADRYLSQPPFGKTCHTCGALIEHHALTTDVKVLEARWAAKQAKKRELDEITDFLS